MNEHTYIYRRIQKISKERAEILNRAHNWHDMGRLVEIEGALKELGRIYNLYDTKKESE